MNQWREAQWESDRGLVSLGRKGESILNWSELIQGHRLLKEWQLVDLT